MNHKELPEFSEYIFVGSTICVSLIIGFIYMFSQPTNSGFDKGDCLVTKKDEIVSKVLQPGKYGIKAVKPIYQGFEDVYLSPLDLNGASKMDCFDLFDNYGNKGV